MSDNNAACHSQDSDATQSDDEQFALPPKKRRALGDKARVPSGSAAAPPAEPAAAAPSALEYDEDNGAAINYEPACSPSAGSPPSQTAPQIPLLRPAALPGQSAHGTSLDSAPEGPAQQDPSSTTALAAGGSGGGASRETSAELPASTPVSQPVAPTVLTEDEPRSLVGDACQPSASPRRADVAQQQQQQQKLADAAMQDGCEGSAQAEPAADAEAGETLGIAASQQKASQEEAGQDDARELQIDAGVSDDAPRQTSHRSVPTEAQLPGAEPLPAPELAADPQSRSCPTASRDAFERVELPGSPASSVDHGRLSSRSRQPMATSPAEFERAELPPSPDTGSDERRTSPCSASRRSQPSPLRQPVFPPQEAAFESAELPASGPPSPAPPGNATVQRGELLPLPAHSGGGCSASHATFQREELPQSPSPGAGAQMPRTEAQSGQKRRPASAVCIRGPATHDDDDVAFQREELPDSPLPNAAPKAAPAGASLQRGVGRLPPALDGAAPAPASRMFQREELPLSPPAGARSPVLSGANSQHEELPLPPPSTAGAHPATRRAVFQREELQESPPQAGGAATSAAATIFQREELSPSPQQMHGADTAAPRAAFERVELPPSPTPAFGMGTADSAAILNYEDLPPAPADSEGTLSARLHQDGASDGVQNPVASAATFAPPQQHIVAARVSQAQPGLARVHVPVDQPDANTSENGRSAKAISWLRRRGKLPPMQARARVSQH